MILIGYDFGKHGRGLGKTVFALALDRKKMTERIVIGEMGRAMFILTRPARLESC